MAADTFINTNQRSPLIFGLFCTYISSFTEGESTSYDPCRQEALIDDSN
jgi:hypothetical protein